MTRAVSRACGRAGRYHDRRPDLTGMGHVCAAFDWFRIEAAEADPAVSEQARAGVTKSLEHWAGWLNGRKRATS